MCTPRFISTLGHVIWCLGQHSNCLNPLDRPDRFYALMYFFSEDLALPYRTVPCTKTARPTLHYLTILLPYLTILPQHHTKHNLAMHDSTNPYLINIETYHMKWKIIILTLPCLIIHRLTGDDPTEPDQTLNVKQYFYFHRIKIWSKTFSHISIYIISTIIDNNMLMYVSKIYIIFVFR